MITRCKYCNSTNLKHETLPENSIHYAKIICNNCLKWLAWLPNPKSPRNNNYRISKKTVSDVIKFHGFKEEFCFLCLRTREQLGNKETLTIDHIKELKNTGEEGNNIQNMQVLCSACHKLKNWLRLYFNWHLNKRGENDTQTTPE